MIYWFYVIPLVWVILFFTIAALNDWRKGSNINLGDVLWVLFVAVIPGLNIICGIWFMIELIRQAEKITLIKGSKKAK